jgi:hypothetical protein
VVLGEPGSGASWTVPQTVLEEAMARGGGAEASIACVQPNRISAVALAQRVAEDWGQVVGDVVGYQVGAVSASGSRTCLRFCTAGTPHTSSACRCGTPALPACYAPLLRQYILPCVERACSVH